jgi:hypothetical protein
VLPELRRRKAEWVRLELKVKVRHLKGSETALVDRRLRSDRPGEDTAGGEERRR